MNILENVIFCHHIPIFLKKKRIMFDNPDNITCFQKALQHCTCDTSFITLAFIVSEINVRMCNVTFLTHVISVFKAMLAALYPENYFS